MIFELILTSNKNRLINKKNSALVKFFHEKELSKKFNLFLKQEKIELNQNQAANFFAKKEELLFAFTHKGSPDLLIAKKHKDENLTNDLLRNTLSAIIIRLKNESIQNLEIDIPPYSDFKELFSSETNYFESALEGIYLGNYDFEIYKTEKSKKQKLNVNIMSEGKTISSDQLLNCQNKMKAVSFARDLVNEPASTLTPQELARRVKLNLKHNSLRIKILNKKELQNRKMNAILAVGAASENDPLLIELHYKPSGKLKRKIALVGKGVTYDSGGLSIKPTSSMLEMKGDMAGAAAVIGTIAAAAALKLPIEIIGVIPAVENMISGKSYKPGDIVKTASGKSIEVKDTDAEGRIILADALEYACKQKPDEIIDFATLTGACVVALGETTAAMFTKNDKLAQALEDSSKSSFERIWRMPFYSDYKEQLKSEMADISNLGTRWGGSITAAIFLEHFVDKKIPYVHLDIAGPALKHKFTSYTEKYDTGFGVRLMIDYLSNLA
ncbi:MAG: leucyl aminopeptidase [Bacteroidota bacterium]